MEQNDYDVIVIGAGLGGLTAASFLAMENLKVLVLEMHDKPGGLATRFKRKDFTFDVSLHNFGPLYENFVLSNIFKKLGIIDKIDYIHYNNFQRLIFPCHDLIVEKGIYNYFCALKKMFPREEKGLFSLFEEMSELKMEFDKIEGIDFLAGNPDEEEFRFSPINFPSLVRLVYTTYGELMGRFVTDEKLKGILGALWWIYGLPPDQVASILYSVPSMNFYNFSGGYIRGTSQKISDLLSEKIINNGGKIVLNTRVDKIMTMDNHVLGIITDRNEIIKSDVIISNISPYETFINLIDEDAAKTFVKKLNDMQLSISCVQLYLGLNCKPRSLGFDNHNITVFSSYDHNENYGYAIKGDYEKIFFSVTDYSDFEEGGKSEERGTVCIMSLDSINNWKNLNKKEYGKKKKEVTSILIRRLEGIIPGISEHIEVAELATPVTVKRYTGHPEGSIYGYSQTVEQSGINRLDPETPFKNLYLCGANVYPGAGYSSVINSGYKASKKIVNEFFKLNKR